MLEHSLVHLGGYTWCLFPWLGTRSFRTARRLIQSESKRFGINGVEYEGCYFIRFQMSKGSDYELMQALASRAEEGIDANSLVGSGEIPVFEKYDNYVPADLLRFAYATDKLNPIEAGERMKEIYQQF